MRLLLIKLIPLGKLKRLLFIALFMQSLLFPVGEAGGILLLIQPGAESAGGTGGIVARTDNSLMSYYNPSGLAFLTKSHVSLSHTQNVWFWWREGTYNFLSFSHPLNEMTAIGGNVSNLYSDMTHIRSDEAGNYSYYSDKLEYLTITLNYSRMLSSSSSIGFGLKLLRLKQDFPGSSASSTPPWTENNALFDLGYLKKFKALDFGVSILNIGDKISFIDPAQTDPPPINLRAGISSVFYNDIGSLRFSFDIQKLLVGSYADMDWDGDGYIGRYDENGHYNGSGDYNSDGQIETVHTDEWYVGLFTSWVDDWFLRGDRDIPTRGQSDGIIGGYAWDDKDGDGVVDLEDDEIVSAGFNEGFNFNDSEWGIYNEEGIKEVGNRHNRSIQDEIDKLRYNSGIEYEYKHFVFRYGYYYDKEGKTEHSSYGLGYNYKGFHIDYAQIDREYQMEKTQYFSLSYEF